MERNLAEAVALSDLTAAHTPALTDGQAASSCPCRQGAASTSVTMASCRATPADVFFDYCEDIKCANIGDAIIESQGRILDVTATLRNVCPGKRVAVGITLMEVDPNGTSHPRGIKTLLVPAQGGMACVDVQLPSARFILPEEDSATIPHSNSTCSNQRHFTVRVDAHYADVTGVPCS
ncbi:hypothetical protein LI291_00410 [Intestinibacillus massiliensis]|uniref:hypothetical protein n=1 Tax=Intestinibacillus massiliensis TaxID=1871029 RepID=UPI000B363738|nr:hypothetical protein [Intestinibacillus massiliensis]MCB6364656.1 hypothetical protein [Intestinibacillus massiliensis]